MIENEYVCPICGAEVSSRSETGAGDMFCIGGVAGDEHARIEMEKKTGGLF